MLGLKRGVVSYTGSHGILDRDSHIQLPPPTSCVPLCVPTSVWRHVPRNTGLLGMEFFSLGMSGKVRVAFVCHR